MAMRHTLREILHMHPEPFRVPRYQRHYVWGQYHQGSIDQVKYLTEALIAAYKNGEDYFLQGISVTATHLVDGQQRLTYLRLLLGFLGSEIYPRLAFDDRKDAQRWLDSPDFTNIAEDGDETSQDVYYYKRTLRTIETLLDGTGIGPTRLADYILDHVTLLYISLPEGTNEVAIYKMMNGSKSSMAPADIIKTVIIHTATDPQQQADTQALIDLRSRYAQEWNTWVRWWNRQDVTEYYSPLGQRGIDTLLKLCLRDTSDGLSADLSYEEVNAYLNDRASKPYHRAKHLFYDLRAVQRRIEDAFSDSTTYNRIRAITLLQDQESLFRFLKHYFHGEETAASRQKGAGSSPSLATINADELERYYRLSFLGMTIDQIHDHVSEAEYFEDLMASLSKPDVYHSDTKRDVFNLLLRLNIDEDTKLGRRFDFSVWTDRSLEHIYSKSKVWHIDEDGNICDGNDNRLDVKRSVIERDPAYLHRNRIVNQDGTVLSEHCIGNLVLLYGGNNAAFGNSTFDQKKIMFLTPGDRTVFQSRNLLHTVCIFAGNKWGAQSIVDNYNQTLKNLKIYYGFK